MVKVEKSEDIKEAVKYFVLRSSIWTFKIPRGRLETIKETLKRKEKQRKVIEDESKKIIIKALKFNKDLVISELHSYAYAQPTLQEITEAMVIHLYKEMEFKPSSEGQTKLTEPEVKALEKEVMQEKKRSHHKKQEAQT